LISISEGWEDLWNKHQTIAVLKIHEITMSKAVYLRNLGSRLNEIDIRIAEAKRRLKSDPLPEEVAAAGELALLERKHKQLTDRIAEVEKEPEGAWEDFKTALENDFDALFRDVGNWIERH
jgi:hypothetical protein